MKNILTAKNSFLPLLFLAVIVAFSACKKDNDGSPDIKAGTPVLQSISPTEASGGTVITLSGTGLGDIRSIVFDNNNVPASFTSTLNTDTHILFRVPDTAYGGNQNIILTNSEGKTLTVPFKVIALPIITTAWPSDFQAGSRVTITGNNLDDVTDVVIDGTTDAATIVSKARKSLVIDMPASNVNTGKLKVTNLSGSNVGSQVFVNVDKSVKVFTDGLNNGFESWSWGGAFDPSTDDYVTGGISLKAAYDPAGTWGGLQLGNPGVIDVSACRYFSFWVKGADTDKEMQFWINWADQKTNVKVPANVWTHYVYDMLTDFPSVDKTAVNNVTFQIEDEGKTLYFDNIIFYKE